MRRMFAASTRSFSHSFERRRGSDAVFRRLFSLWRQVAAEAACEEATRPPSLPESTETVSPSSLPLPRSSFPRRRPAPVSDSSSSFSASCALSLLTSRSPYSASSFVARARRLALPLSSSRPALRPRASGASVSAPACSSSSCALSSRTFRKDLLFAPCWAAEAEKPCAPSRALSTSSSSSSPSASSSPSPPRGSDWISAFIHSTEEGLARRTKRIPPTSLSSPSRSSSSSPSSPSASVSSSSASSPGRRGPLFAQFRRVSRLPLEASLQQSLSGLGITHLTQIQDACFLPILLGKDVAAAAKPGTGKTLAYLLPLLQRRLGQARGSVAGDAAGDLLAEGAEASALPGSPGRGGSGRGGGGGGGGPSVLILVPSRELCRQVAATVAALAPTLSQVILDSAYSSLQTQELLLAASRRSGRLDLVIGTPERCEKLFRAGHLRLGALKTCVVDEADALLRRGYAEAMSALFFAKGEAEAAETQRSADGKQDVTREAKAREYPRQRVQTLIFTAALPRDLEQLFDAHFKHATVINLLKKAARLPSGHQAAAASPLLPSPAGEAEGETQARANDSEGEAPSAASLCSDTVRHLTCKISSKRGAHCESETRLRVLLYLLAKALPASAQRRRSPHFQQVGREGDSADAEKQKNARAGEARVAGSGGAAGGIELLEEGDKIEEAKCIVEQLVQHPFLSSWRVAALHAGLEHEQRDANLSRFRSGEASILISTDVAARGIDVPSVTLVVQLRPPLDPTTYIHRSGRAGRGGRAGDSVMLYSATERERISRISQETQVSFINLPPPTQVQEQETTISRLLYEILDVKAEVSAPFLSRAEALLNAHGSAVFAAALAFLHGSHRLPRLQRGAAGNARSEDEAVSRSVLSGRKGYVAVLLYDPTHERIQSISAAARYLRQRLPDSAKLDAVGLVSKSTNGYVGDVAVVYADQVVDDGDAFSEPRASAASIGAINGPPVYPLEQMPRLLLSDEAKRLGRRRKRVKLPWEKMKRAHSRAAILLGSRRKGEVLNSVAAIKQHQRNISRM
ncbi:DEAD/DEAH box helicase domain-containing protein [Besnoitia besnoiti]|uniref:RNA helicase n=1 Tax=Besnoitia besnoiti TaxID=94643 RepID=A0A2A9MGR8_BESBE|nr:DEAD/DEAH box helicase domain-containing protein [Besnoitia besnoiti]PFH35156.1 DEAD/DEAH box helicase domain-containing protein [Besnoitia besnoiti]